MNPGQPHPGRPHARSSQACARAVISRSLAITASPARRNELIDGFTAFLAPKHTMARVRAGRSCHRCLALSNCRALGRRAPARARFSNEA